MIDCCTYINACERLIELCPCSLRRRVAKLCASSDEIYYIRSASILRSIMHACISSVVCTTAIDRDYRVLARINIYGRCQLYIYYITVFSCPIDDPQSEKKLLIEWNLNSSLTARRLEYLFSLLPFYCRRCALLIVISTVCPGLYVPLNMSADDLLGWKTVC